MNLYSIANIITAIAFLLLGIFVFTKNPRGVQNRIFGGLCAANVLWQLSSTVAYNIAAESYAYPVMKVAYVGVIFITALTGHYCYIILKLDKKLRVYRNWIYALTIFFAVLNLTTPLVLSSVHKYFWGYYPIRGVLNPIFLLYYIGNINVTVGLMAYYLFFKREQLNQLQVNQVKFVFIGFCIYAIACVDFIPNYGIAIYPFGYIPCFILISIIGFTIVRYKLMEIDTVIHKTFLWLSTLLLLVLPAALIEALLMSFVLKSLSASQVVVVNTLLATVYLILFVTYYSRFRPCIDHFFRRRKYDYQTILGKVAEKIATTISIEDLSSQLLTEVCEAMYLRNAVLYVLTKDQKRYSIMGRRGYKEVDGIRQRTALEIFSDEERKCMAEPERQIDCATTLAQWFAAQQEVIEKEQVEFDPRYEKIKEDASACFRAHDVEVVVPLMVKGGVNALLGLGKKENLQAYTIKDIELLKKLGQEAGVTVFNALHYEQLAETERLEEEMKMGRQIQMALLPQKTPNVSRLNVQGLMQPAKEIGGDYYDFVSMPDKEKLAIVIGDVSGKGVAAGLLMSMVKATIHTLSQESVAPKRLLLRINQMLYQNIQAQKFMTLLYFVWQPRDQTLTYSSAGHEHILLWRNQSSQIEEIQSGGFMLGMLADIDMYLEEKEIKLQPRDKVLLYTDGVTEAENGSGDRFNLMRLKESLQRHSQQPAQQLMQSIKDEVYGFIGTQPQYDDITLVVLEAE
jgi:serine phosphatase RsbU (regulator of sigma subunit)